MSLMGTLAKVAVGILVAKTVGGLLKGGQSGGRVGLPPGGPWGGGSGGPMGRDRDAGGPFGRAGGRVARRGGRETGLEDMMGDIFENSPGATAPAPKRRAPEQDPFGRDSGPVVAEEPGAPAPRQGQGGGLGDLLEQLGGGRRQGRFDDVFGRSGGGGGSGGLGDILGGVIAGTRGATGPGGSFGEVLNDAFRRGGEPGPAPSRAQEAAAALLLRAMIQAARSDGRIDPAEQKKLMDSLGQAEPAEMDFVRRELRAPVDVAGLCRQVPDGLQPQVYAVSLMAIDLDNRVEAQYLHDLASGLGLGRGEVNDIHARLGVQPLYS